MKEFSLYSMADRVEIQNYLGDDFIINNPVEWKLRLSKPGMKKKKHYKTVCWE